VQQREEIVARKEEMLAEKRELEIKKLRSSQVLSKVQHCVGLQLCSNIYMRILTVLLKKTNTIY